jgi:hypothetical protein
MNRRDQELLDKQLRGLHIAPRHDGVMMLAIVAVFFVGLCFGGFLFPRHTAQMQIAYNPAPATALHSNAQTAQRSVQQ